MTDPPLPPVVFLGPSAPPEDLSALLPQALVRPPVRRGDLYRYRILQHSVFVVIDGAFADRLAISPREVVDVMRDGAIVIGASSMGALRAADCAPAGAIGVGLIYRLYRNRAISSEDEVAVSYCEERPYPAISVPLVNMRVALHRAVRRRLMTPCEAERAVVAAEALPYRDRGWCKAFANAGVRPSARAEAFLAATDVKREDTRLALQRIARWQASGARAMGSPRRSAHVFGLLGDGRQRSPDPLRGAHPRTLRTDFASWLALSGAGRQAAPGSAADIGLAPVDPDEIPRRAEDIWTSVSRSPELQALLMRFEVFRRAHSEATRLGLLPDQRDTGSAELELAHAHGCATWQELIRETAAAPALTAALERHSRAVALTKCLRKRLFRAHGTNRRQPEDTVVWRNS